ncbi:MAG TPA: M50 family metallopeptidase [Myxococcota bacterium]|nr:M50 family metallopeptidase [Myxococcota bacterium]
MSVATSILGISVLIILHELGHYLVAKWCNMRVLKFSLGFGPVIAKRTFGETQWQLAAIPLGGFVQVDGMGPKETDVYEDDARNYRNRPIWMRAAVIAAGPVMNWVIAAFLIGVLVMSVGYERPDDAPRLGVVVDGSAAQDAGLQPGDTILKFAGDVPTNWADVVRSVRAHPDQAVPVEVEREGQRFVLEVTPKNDGKGHGMLGVQQSTVRERESIGGGIAFAVKETWRRTVDQVRLIAGLIMRTNDATLSGLPGMVRIMSGAASRGFEQFMLILAAVSLGLCIFNVFPFPTLDGGRLVFLIAEALRGRPVNERIEAMVHTVGFVLILALIVFVSVRDLIFPIHG